MNKRTRKKKGLGEFDHKGFEIELTFPRSMSIEEVDEFVDSFCEFSESINLGVGGGGTDTQMSWFVTKYLPGKRKPNGRRHFKQVPCTAKDQDAVKAWIEEKVSGTVVKVGSLIGCNTGK